METTETNLSPQEEKEIEETAKKINITKTGLGKKEKIVLFSTLGGTVILLIASGLLIFYQINGSGTKIFNGNINQPIEPSGNTNLNVNAPTNTEVKPATYDQDKDKLPDEEERTIWKTDPKKADTDGDNLSDFQEVRTYNTDPLNKDTDADGYNDGEEINGGFNPLGPGKLTQ